MIKIYTRLLTSILIAIFVYDCAGSPYKKMSIENPEELSGLTRSFFYSGANSILVSHWPVVSDSAVKLTTQMIKYMKSNELSNGMALQRSMIDFINNVNEDYEAHPIFWAPFMLIGENR